MSKAAISRTGEQSDFLRDRFLVFLSVSYLAFWTWAAINPLYRSDWLLENLLVFAAVAVLVGTFRYFRFSNLSYFLIWTFMLLHTYGSHYTYAEAPFDWLNNLFGADRNNYDRLVHLSYGLLLAFPTLEFLRRVVRVLGFWAYFLATTVILATGGLYELIEMWTALVVAPELGAAYLGTQGDVWDAQKDIALALYGALVAMGLTALVSKLLLTGAATAGGGLPENR